MKFKGQEELLVPAVVDEELTGSETIPILTEFVLVGLLGRLAGWSFSVDIFLEANHNAVAQQDMRVAIS